VNASPGGLDGGFEEEPARPLLPPSDRLWRHPSELDPVALHPAAVRRRWLLSHPSRRSVLTAGIVGALIASAVAAIATHVADSMSTASPPKAIDPPRVVTTPQPRYPLSPGIESAVKRVASALVTVEATSGAVKTRELGVIIRSNGMLLVPSRGLVGSQSLLVYLANDDVPYVGNVVGTDPGSGLAVVHINGADNLPTVTFSRSPEIDPTVALDVSSPGRVSYTLGMLHATHAIVRIDGRAILGAMTTGFPTAYCPSGSALLSSAGTIDGVAVGDSSGMAVIVPAWLASNVARDLIAAGTIVQGWLGLRGVTNSYWPGGVRIVSIAKGSVLRRDGVLPGEAIVEFGAVRIHSMEDLRARLHGLRPGDRVTLGIVGDGSMSRFSVALSATESP
jgi:putative serine protease PepD